MMRRRRFPGLVVSTPLAIAAAPFAACGKADGAGLRKSAVEAPAGDLCRGGGARAAIGDLCRIISELDRRHRGTSPADPVSAPPAPGRRVEGTVAGPMAVTHAALPLGRC